MANCRESTGRRHDPEVPPMTVVHCWIHHQDEEVPEDVYRICFECSHVYTTPESLIISYNSDLDELNQKALFPIPVKKLGEEDTIFFCPECLHDF